METDPSKYTHTERPAGSPEPTLVEGKPPTQTGRPRAQSMHPDAHAGADPRPGRQRTEASERRSKARDSQSTDSAMNADAEMSRIAARVKQTVKHTVKQSKATIRRHPLVMVGGAFALGILSTRGLPKILVRTAVALGLRVVVGRLLDASMTESAAS